MNQNLKAMELAIKIIKLIIIISIFLFVFPMVMGKVGSTDAETPKQNV